MVPSENGRSLPLPGRYKGFFCCGLTGNYIRDVPTNREYGVEDRSAHCDVVEITPEMIAAGVNALCLFRLSEDCLEEVADEIYRSMRPLEGRSVPAIEEALPNSGDCHFSSEDEDRVDKQTLRNEGTADAIWAIMQKRERPLGGN